MKHMTVHRDKTLGFEAAKLLGTPFVVGLSKYYYAYKIVRTDDGWKVACRSTLPGSSWDVQSMYAPSGIKQLFDRGNVQPVTLHDEAEG